MVDHITVAILQTIIGLIAIIANAVMQIIAVVNINKSTVANADTVEATKMLYSAIAIQVIAAVLMITAFILLLKYKNEVKKHINKLSYIALVTAGVLLLVGGSIGSAVTMRLQCYKGQDANIETAWKMSTASAVTGIMGSIVLLIVQLFVRKDTIAEKARQYFANKDPYVVPPPPPPVDTPTSVRANMPSRNRVTDRARQAHMLGNYY